MTRKCKNCKTPFIPRSTSQIACSVECVRSIQEKQKSKEWKVKKKELKEKIATLTDHRKKARYWFQRFIRIRDLGKTCISCPTKLQDIRAYDAGHYQDAVSHSALMFDEFNCSGQCVFCNQHKSGNKIEYRKGLIARYGVEEVERLESGEKSRKWTKAEYQEIADIYKLKIKEYGNGQ